ncbi:MAG: MFS transporter [Desulfobacterales bacterium]
MFYGWWLVIAFFFIALYVGAAVFWGFTAFMEPLVKEFGWSYAQISLASSLRGLEMGLLSPIVGILVDRFGSRKLIILGVTSIGLGLIALSRTSSLITFYGAMLVLAFGAGSCTTVVLMSCTANWFQRRIGLAMGIVASGFGASGLMIPLIVYLIDAFGWRPALMLLGCGMWIIGIPLTFMIRERPQDHGLLPDGMPLGEETSPVHSWDKEKASQPDLMQAFFSATFLSLFSVEIIRMIVASSVGLHIMPYLGQIGFSRKYAGLVAAGVPLFSILGRFGFGWVSDSFEKHWVLVISFAAMAFGLIALCYIDVGGGVILFLMLFAPGMGAGMVLRGAILRDHFRLEIFGRLIGCIVGASAIGGIIGPYLGGWLFDVLGTYRPLWFSYIGLSVLAGFLALNIRSGRQSV